LDSHEWGVRVSPRQSENDERERALDREIERYREAAAAALEQLEWGIGYLREIHRPEIARALDRNRRQIVESIR
jgi:hypothetical protein